MTCREMSFRIHSIEKIIDSGPLFHLNMEMTNILITEEEYSVFRVMRSNLRGLNNG